MNKRWPIAAGCLLVACIALYFTFFRASDEERIKKTIGEFATIVSVKSGDTLISRIARLRNRMADVARDDITVDVAELGMNVDGRKQLEDAAAKAGLLYAEADCTFVYSKIEIDPAATLAQVDATALVTAMRGAERHVDKRPVHFLMRNDGGWKIASIKVAMKTSD